MSTIATESTADPVASISTEGLLANLLRHSPDKIYFKDKQSRFIKVNDAMARFFGLKAPEDIVGKTDFDYFGFLHASAAFEDEQKLILTGEPIIDKEEYENWPDGRITWASSTKVPMRDEAGHIIGIMGISRDITERKTVQAERDRVLAELQGAVSHIKSLSGLLPICAYCKQIRDDEGAWVEVESYIARKSDANFSHGICPQCLAKHCPDPA